MAYKRAFITVLVLVWGVFMLEAAVMASVVKKDGKTFIVDRLGEYWDVTQAVSMGFRPGKFQHGIGRNTFVTLDDSDLGVPDYLFDSHRVLGVEGDGQAHAYSVSKLSRHEIANTTLGGAPIAAAY